MPPGTMDSGEGEESNDEHNDEKLEESDFGLCTQLRKRREWGRPWGLGIERLIGVASTCQPESVEGGCCALEGSVLTSVGLKNAQVHDTIDASGSITPKTR